MRKEPYVDELWYDSVEGTILFVSKYFIIALNMSNLYVNRSCPYSILPSIYLPICTYVCLSEKSFILLS